MSKSKKIIAFQGAYGAYSDLACRTACPDYNTLPCTSFEAAMNAVLDGKADLAMIPVDNTIAGRVADVHHLLPESNLFIVKEHFQPVKHCLLGVQGASLNTIKHVHSHIHALPQCRKLISDLGLEAHVYSDTAGAARHVAEQNDPEHASISSALAAEIYDLNILKENVQDTHHNTTRFLILATEPDIPEYREDKTFITTLTFAVRNIPAALYKSLGGFATNGLNMAKIESYVDENFQAALFYCDIEGHPDSISFQLALEELGFYAKDVKFLGTYSGHSFRN